MSELTSHRIRDVTSSLDSQLQVLVCDEEGPGGAHHDYKILTPAYQADIPYRILCHIKFQKGGVKEAGGVNGISIESLLAIVQHRLECFQNGPFSSEYNADALSHVEQAIARLHARTTDRIARNVEGVSVA